MLKLLSFEEITRVAKIFVELGVKKVRLTGGEPLLRRDLPCLVQMLAKVPTLEDLALTTNGTLLPQLAEPLAKGGLKRVTVSLDALDKDIFRRMSGDVTSPEQVTTGIETALDAGEREAEAMLRVHLVEAAVLMLKGETRVVDRASRAIAA